MGKVVYIKFLFLLCLMANMQQVRGQSVFETEFDRKLYETKVKLVDEFFERFNGNEVREDIKDNMGFGQRKTNLLLLFNSSMFKPFEDSLFIEASKFVDEVIKDSVQIKYEDSLWVAKAVCKGTYRGKSVSFVLYLNVEKRSEDMYKWVIAKAEGDLFNISPVNDSPRIMLMPDDHETDFMSLYRATAENEKNIMRYSQNRFQIDCTSVFYSMVYTGLLKIGQVESLEFIFLQVPNYVFSIKETKRNTFNSGWLINSFQLMDGEQKSKFINYIYNNSKE